MLNFTAIIEIDGKPEPKDWTFNGKSGKSYRLNISQNNGCDTETVVCSEAVYNSVRRHDEVTGFFTYVEGKEKTSLKLDSVAPFTDTPAKPNASITASASGAASSKR